MASEICPSLFFIVPDENTKPYNENDIFKPDRFRILQAESLTNVKELVFNTGTNQPVQIRLLCCYRIKNMKENYCAHRYVEHPEKQLCDEKSGMMNQFFHFNVKMKNHSTEYLLAFLEGADLHNNIAEIVHELFCSADWLEIMNQQVFLYVLTFGSPAFKTRNLNYLEERINSTRKNPEYNIECDITHICNDFKNCLCVSLNKKNLVFNAS